MTGEFAAAVHALVVLNHKNTTVSSEALSKNVCTHPARLRRVLAKLKKTGLVESREGTEGGYSFSGDPADVNLRHVAEALEVRLVSSSWRSGSADMDCLISSGMADIMDDIYAQMNGICLAKLEGTTIADIDSKIFGEKNRK